MSGRNAFINGWDVDDSVRSDRIRAWYPPRTPPQTHTLLQRTVEPIRMERLRAAAAGFAETVATFGFALLLGYLAYRVLWGISDDPRRH